MDPANKWDDHLFVTNQILSVLAFFGIFRGITSVLRLVESTRFLTYMVKKTIQDMIPFVLYFNCQILFLAVVFILMDNQEEEFLTFDADIPDYPNRNFLFRAYLKTLDFSQGKNEYRFKTFTGSIMYVFGIIFLNIVILNLVIAIVGNVFEAVMAVKKETELKLKAEILLDLY